MGFDQKYEILPLFKLKKYVFEIKKNRHRRWEPDQRLKFRLRIVAKSALEKKRERKKVKSWFEFLDLMGNSSLVFVAHFKLTVLSLSSWAKAYAPAFILLPI